MWKKILAAALSAVTAAIEAVTAAIEAGTADQYNCITAQNTADVPLLYGKGSYRLNLLVRVYGCEIIDDVKNTESIILTNHLESLR